MVCLGDELTHDEKGVLMPAQETKGQFVLTLFSGIARRYDFANHCLSFGMDYLWRRKAARIARAWHPARILDLATGSGDLALSLRGACPESLLVSADFCLPMLLVAQRKGLGNLAVADGMHLPFANGSFDALSVAFGLRNMESWPGALGEMGRVLKTGGHLLVLDFSVPSGPIRWLYRPYLHHVLPRLAAFLTGEKAAYDYLGDSIEKFPCGPEMCRLIESAGFAEAKCETLSGGLVSIYTARRI